MSRRVILLRGLVVAVLLLLVALPGHGQDAESKALKYHSVLLKRPAPGYLFDRFYNTWLDLGTLDELREFLQQQVDEHNRTADRLILAFFHAKQGDEVTALQQFRTALANDPGSAQAWYQKAVVEARTLDFETAIADLETAGKTEPDDKLAIAIAKLQGRLYVRNRQTAQALAVWAALLTAHPEDEYLYEDIIELQIGEGLYDEAAALSQKLIDRTTDKYKQVLRRVRLGDIHQRAGQRSKALDVYGDTLELVGHGSWLEQEILAQIEQLFRREDDLTGLQEHYKKLLEKYAQRIQIRKQYAKLLSELGDGDAACEQFEEILRLTPGDRANSEAYVTLLADTDNLPKAIEVTQSLITQHPSDGELRLRLAGLHHQADDKQAAEDAVLQYLDASDKGEYAYLRSARMLQQFELHDAAEKIYERLTQAFPDSTAAREAQAAFLYDRGKKDRALAIWRKLAAGQGRSQLVHVARVLATRNEHQAAYDILTPRREEFADDPIYLGQLVTSAIALKKLDEALPWTQRRVQLAGTASELETAIVQAAQVAEQADRVQPLIEELTAVARRCVQDTCLLAELLERTGDSRRADKVLADVQDQQNLLIVAQQIRLQTQRRDWHRAAEATRRLVELPGGRKSIYVRRLVELYQRDFKFDEAIHWIQEWKKLSPGSTLPWLTESRLLTQHGKPDEAIDALRAAAQQFEDDPDVRARLAGLYIETGKLDDAQRIYWRLYEDGKDLNDKLRWVQQLAETAELQGKTEQLIEEFEDRRRTNRTSLEPLLALAEIHRADHNYEERRKALLEASRLKSDDLNLLHLIARVEETEGDWQRALATLERAALLDTTPRTREKIARLHLHHGDPEKGYAILHELAGGATSDARSVEAIAEAMISVQDWERASEYLAPLLAQHPDDYRLRYLFAVAREEAGELMPAVEIFLLLLTVDKEISGLTGQAPQAPWGGFLGPLTSLVPQESIDLLQLRWLGEMVYSHRQSIGRRLSGRMRYGGLGQATVLMPHDVAAARQYSLAHVVTIARMMNDDERDDLCRKMRDHGVTNAEVLLKLSPGPNERDSIESLAKEHPRDRGLMALGVLMGMQGGRHDNAESVAAAYELFKNDRPQLALMAAAQASSADEKYTKLLDEALNALPAKITPNLFLVMSISSTLGGGFGGASPTTLPEPYKQRLTQKLIEWYPNLTNLGPQGYMVFFIIAQALSTSDNPAAYFAFLDSEVTRWRKTGGRTGGSMLMGFMGGGDEPFIQPLGFPPDILSDFPPAIQQLLQAGDNYDPFGRPSVAGLWEPKAVEKHLATVTDPTLKILLAHKFDLPDAIEPTLDQMLKAEQPQLDAFLLAAAKASVDDNQQVASELLDKSRYLPMTRQVRKRIDSALVAMALQGLANAGDPPAGQPASPLTGGIMKALATLRKLSGGTGGSPSADSIVDAGRKAALRLRRANLEMEERQQLVAALGDLGLSEEAEKLDQVTAQIMPGGMSYSTATSNSERVITLLAEGKQEEALRAVVNDVMLHAQYAISQPGSYNSRRYEALALRQLIQSFGLMEEVLARLDPGESRSVLKLRQYGMACEMFNQKEKAREAYTKALADREKDDGIRLRLMLLEADRDATVATQHLDQLDPRNIQQAGEAIGEFLGEGDIDLEKRFQLVESLSQYLARLPDTRKMDLSWVPELAESLAEPYENQHAILRNLYVKRSDGEPPERTADEPEVLHRQVHEHLCRTMLKIPQLAPEGFTRLLAVAESEGKVNDEFVKLALQALLTYKPFRGPVGYRGLPSLLEDDPDEERVSFRTPEEFLVRHAWKTGNLAMIHNEVVPALEQAGQSEQAKLLQEQLVLYTCPADEFVDEANSFLAGQKRQSRFPVPEGIFPAMAKVVETWEERELTTDIEPLIVEQLEKGVGSAYFDDAPPYVCRYALALTRKGQRARVAAFVQQLAELYLGPKEKRAELIEKHFERHSVTSGTINARIHAFVEIIGQLSQQRELFFLALDTLVENGLTKDAHDLEYQGRSIVRAAEAKGGVAETVVEYLETSPYLANLDEFRLYEASDGSYGRILFMVLNELHVLSEGDRGQVRDRLEAREPKTFGVGLVAACLVDEPSVGALEFAAKHETVIKAAPATKQQMIVDLLERLASHDPYEESETETELSDGARRFQAWSKDMRVEARMGLVQPILDAKRLQDIPKESPEFLGDVMEVLPRLIESDPEKADRLFQKSVDLFEESRRRGAARFGYSEDSVVAHLLLGMLDGQRDLTTTAFAIDILFKKIAASMEIPHNVQRHMCESVEQAAADARQLLPDDDLHPGLTALQKSYQTLGGAFGSRPTTILASAYFDAAEHLTGEQLDDAIRWADAEAEGGAFPEIARELAAAARFVKARKNRGENEDGVPARRPDQLADYHRYYLSVLTDDELPLTWRLNVAFVLVAHEPRYLPVPAVLACAKLVGDAYDAKVPISGSQVMATLEAVLSLERDETWKKSATDLAAAWNKVRLRTPTSHAGGFGRYEDSEEASLILKLNLLLENESEVAQLLRHHAAALSDRLATFAMLVRHGKHAMAARMLRLGWHRMDMDADESNLVSYDHTLHAALPEFLNTLARDDLKYFAEVVLSTLPDTREEGQTPPTARDERIRDLCRRFAEAPYASDTMREMVLAILTENDEAARLLAEPLAQAAKRVDLVAVMEVRDHQLQLRKHGLVTNFLRSCIKRRDFPSVVETLDRTTQTDSDESYRGQQALALAVNTVCEVTLEQWSDWTPQEMAEFLPVARKMGTPTEGALYYYYEFSRISAVNVLAHALAGRMDEFEAWWEKLTDEERATFSDSGVDPEIWRMATEAVGKSTPANLPRRLEITTRIFQNAERLGWLSLQRMEIYHTTEQSHVEPLDFVISRGLLSEEELLQHGAKIAEAVPAGGSAWALLATRQQQSKQLDVAAQSWGKAVAGAPQDDQLRQTLWRMQQATVLQDLGQTDEARAVLEGLAPEMIHAPSRDAFERLRNQVQGKPDNPKPVSPTKTDENT